MHFHRRQFLQGLALFSFLKDDSPLFARERAPIPLEFWREFASAQYNADTGMAGRNLSQWWAVSYQRAIPRLALAKRLLGDEKSASIIIGHLRKTFSHRDDKGRFLFTPLAGTRQYELNRTGNAAFFLMELYLAAYIYLNAWPRHPDSLALREMCELTRPDYDTLRDTSLAVAAANVGATNRVLILARALYFGSALFRDPEGKQACVDLLHVVKSLQAREGYFPELGGADLGYHFVAQLHLELIRREWPSDLVLNMSGRGRHWIEKQIEPDGSMNFEVGTRTSRQSPLPAGRVRVNLPEVRGCLVLISDTDSNDRFRIALQKLRNE